MHAPARIEAVPVRYVAPEPTLDCDRRVSASEAWLPADPADVTVVERFDDLLSEETAAFEGRFTLGVASVALARGGASLDAGLPRAIEALLYTLDEKCAVEIDVTSDDRGIDMALSGVARGDSGEVAGRLARAMFANMRHALIVGGDAVRFLPRCPTSPGVPQRSYCLRVIPMSYDIWVRSSRAIGFSPRELEGRLNVIRLRRKATDGHHGDWSRVFRLLHSMPDRLGVRVRLSRVRCSDQMRRTIDEAHRQMLRLDATALETTRTYLKFVSGAS
jgi:hypothetical protein